MAEAPRRRALKCDACGAEIAVRTFKAGTVACPACGVARDLGEELAARLRAVQAQVAQATPEPEPPAAPRTAPGTSRLWIFGLVLLALAAAAWSILS